jgi:hypothetical protein
MDSEDFPMCAKTAELTACEQVLSDPGLVELLKLALATLRQTAEAGLPPERFYKLEFLAGVFEYKSADRFEELLKRNQVPVHLVGKFSKLVKLQDVYDVMLARNLR